MKNDPEIGGFLSETFTIVRDSLRAFGMFIVAMTVIGVGSEWLTLNSGSFVDFEVTQVAFGAIVLGLASLLIVILAQYSLISDMLRSRGQVIEGSPRVAAFLGMSILYYLGVALGMMLLFVPGVILMVRWIAAPSYLIGARYGVTDAMGASWEAIRGKSWHVFGGALVLGLAGFAMIGAVSGGALQALDEFNITFSILTNLMSNAFSAVFAAYGVAVFHLIHDNTDATTEVFE